MACTQPIIRSIISMFWILTNVSGRSLSRPVALPMFFGRTVRVSIGTPPVRFVLAVSFGFADIVVVDRMCGVRDTGCPLYCDDTKFVKFYCKSACRRRSPTTIQLMCQFDDQGELTKNVYDSTASATSRRLDQLEWHTNLPGLRPLYGHRHADTITAKKQLLATPWEADYLRFEEFAFVSAISWDRSLLSSDGGVFGLADGPANPIRQIAVRYGLPPRVTIASDESISRHKWAASHLAVVGQLDKARCVGWEFVQSLGDEQWAFPIDEIDFMGVKLKERAVGIFNILEREFVTSPENIGHLIGEGAVRSIVDISKRYFSALVRPCEFAGDKLLWPNVTIRIGAIRLVLGSKSTFGTSYAIEGKPFCEVKARADRANPHVYANVWTMGKAILREYCVGLDYEKHRIGFAKLRGPPYFYEDYGSTTRLVKNSARMRWAHGSASDHPDGPKRSVRSANASNGIVAR